MTLLLGLSIGALMNWRRHRDEIKRVRSMVRQEMVWIKKAAQGVAAGTPTTMRLLLESLTHTPVYDAYLDRLSILKEGESTVIQELYHWLDAVCGSFSRYSKKQLTTADIIEDLAGLVNDVTEKTGITLKEIEYYSQPWYRRMFRKGRKEEID